MTALQPDTASDLIVIDKNYLDRVNLRRELIAQHGRTVHGCLTSGRDAVREVYSFLLGEYLPCRYPTMFELSADDKTFHNLVTGREHPTVPASDDMASALRVIGETVEDDMFILHHTPEGHFTDAFVCCFPAGFDGSEKLGKLLGDVHAPVPSYDKIGPSMERFFRKLEVGKSVKRTNVSRSPGRCPSPASKMLTHGSGRYKRAESCSTARHTPRQPTMVLLKKKPSVLTM